MVGRCTTLRANQLTQQLLTLTYGQTHLRLKVQETTHLDDSREFCVERAGNYYHKDEVSAWANLDWQGKRRGTTESTIFIYAGGYRCLHQIIYVSELVVPDEVVRRAKTKGIYT